MTDDPKPPRKVRFTMLEPMEPLNPSPEELASRRVEISFRQPVTMLEPMGPNDPPPEELVVPPAVQNMIVQLADAIGALEPGVRAVAVAELTKRLAG